MTRNEAIKLLNDFTTMLLGWNEAQLQSRWSREVDPVEFDALNEAWKTAGGGSGLLLSSGRLASATLDELQRAGFPRAQEKKRTTTWLLAGGAAAAAILVGWFAFARWRRA